jgi:hypothetical protein
MPVILEVLLGMQAATYATTATWPTALPRMCGTCRVLP